MNDDTQGYHHTVTMLYARALAAFAAARAPGGPLAETVNAALTSAIGQRDWPLRHYSPQRLFSVAVRRNWLEPDLTAI